MNDEKEVLPPWIEFPGFPPGDGFWRQSGEAWLTLVWEPFWENLTPEKQDSYLAKWRVPDQWRCFYFDKEFQQWLESVDDDEPNG